MWHAMAVASRPSLRIAAATSSLASSLRLDTTTFAPARARASAIARPIPRLDPVTTAVLPVRSNKPSSIESLRDHVSDFFAGVFLNKVSRAGDRHGWGHVLEHRSEERLGRRCDGIFRAERQLHRQILRLQPFQRLPIFECTRMIRTNGYQRGKL